MASARRKLAKSDSANATLLPDLDRLKAHEEQIRQEKIAYLKKELAISRERTQVLEKELRLAGLPHSEIGGGRTSWDEIFKRIGPDFSAKELRSLTGANGNLAASVIFRWRKQGRIRPTGRRGQYRKAIR